MTDTMTDINRTGDGAIIDDVDVTPSDTYETESLEEKVEAATETANEAADEQYMLTPRPGGIENELAGLKHGEIPDYLDGKFTFSYDPDTNKLSLEVGEDKIVGHLTKFDGGYEFELSDETEITTYSMQLLANNATGRSGQAEFGDRVLGGVYRALDEYRSD
jgi:GH18 family chitinase